MKTWSTSQRWEGVDDVLIGATQLVAEYQGTAKSSHVRDKIVEMIHLNETIACCSLTTMGTGAVSYLVESMHGAGSPQAQKIMIGRLADVERMKNSARRVAGIGS